MTINYKTAKNIIAGSSIFSTGGGFEYSAQLKKIKSIFQKKTLEIISIDELNDEDYICTAYGVGSSSNNEVDLSEPLMKGFSVLEELTGKKYKGIFAGETNIECLVFQTASFTNLPIIDADCTGGRAVPQIQFDNLFVANKTIVPVIVVTMKGDVIILKESNNPAFIENFVRDIAVSTKDSVAVIDHSMSVKEAKKILTFGIFERSKKIGDIINSEININSKINKVIQTSQSTTLFEGFVNSINLKDIDGFLFGDVTINNKNQTARLYIKNETIACKVNNEIVVTAPDLITLIDKKTAFGIHNSQLSKGQEVLVTGIKGTELWRDQHGKSIFNPQACGFKLEVKLLD